MAKDLNWWDNHDTLVSVATHADEEGEFVTPTDAIAFFEKPWHYEELYRAWDTWMCAAGEAQDEYNAREP